MKISRQLWLIVGVALIGMLAVWATGLFQLRTELFADRQNKTRNIVEVAQSVASHYADLEKNGKMSREEAQAAALDAIGAMRYDKTQYLWVNSVDAVMIMHPVSPGLNGKDLSTMTDGNGKPFFMEMCRLVKAEGEGFVDYLWPKPGDDKTPVPKISFVKGLPQWGWVIGSGIYVDDVAAIFWERALVAGLFAAFFLGLQLVVSGFIGRRLTVPLVTMAGAVARLARGEKADIPSTEAQNEIGDIARSLAAIYHTGVDAQRIKAALDMAAACVLVTDTDGLVIYQNAALSQMFSANQDEIAKAMPGFRASQVVGQSVARFTAGRNTTLTLREPGRDRIVLGHCTFDVLSNPVRSADGEALGAVIEWQELTLELDAQAEVDIIVRRALDGDFTGRIGLDGKTAFMRSLSESMNELLTLTSDAVSDLATMLQGLAQGDLTHRITRSYRGVLEHLKSDANTTAEKLSAIVGEIAEAAIAVNTAALEIAESGNDLSKRSEQQAAGLEQTAAAMEELTATVKQNSGNAHQAKDLAHSASNSADQGGQVAGSAVEAMGRIQGSSQRISDIVGVIDEIAFQTNLLALNAAVEAARAGEAGKGFAVVAQEVRSLAQRCGEASKEIRALVQASTGEVKTGVALVNQAGTTLNDIVASIRKVAAIVTDIASASSEQADGLDDINASMAHMDEMTQQNAAMTEESTAAAHQLQEQATRLQGLVSFFKTESRKAAVGAKPAPVFKGAPAKPGAARSAAAPVAKARPLAADADWEEF